MDDDLLDLAERIAAEAMDEDDAIIWRAMQSPISFLPCVHLEALDTRADDNAGVVDVEQFREILEELERRLYTVPATLSPDERQDYTRTLAAATVNAHDYQSQRRICEYLWGER